MRSMSLNTTQNGCRMCLQQAHEVPGPVLSTAAALLDQRVRRQERRAASVRSSERRRRIDALSAAAGAIAMVRFGNPLLTHICTPGQAAASWLRM